MAAASSTAANPFYTRGKIAGVYPALTDRRDEAYVEFIEDARNILMHAQQAPIADYSRQLITAAGLPSDPGEVNTAKATELLMTDPALRTYYCVKRALQECFWTCINESYGRRGEELEAALAAAEIQGPGSLEYDPDWVPPDYAHAEIHLQPGGYIHNLLAGPLYDYGLKVFMGGGADNDLIAKQVAQMTAAPEDGSVVRVLDLGCSAGATTIALKERFPEATVTGIDVSSAMLRYAHLRALEADSDVAFRQMAAEALHLPDDDADIVLAMLLFHEVPVDAGRQILAEAFRVLRPGGVLTIVDFPGDHSRDVYSMFFAEMDASDNGEPFLPGFVRSNVEELMAEAGFAVAPYDPSRFLLAPRIGIKPSD